MKINIERGIDSLQRLDALLIREQGTMQQHSGMKGKQPAAPLNAVEQLIKQAGLVATPELKQAVQMAQRLDAVLNKEIFQQMNRFLSTASGTTEQKMETIRVVVERKLEPSMQQLNAVHEALHGKGLAAGRESILIDSSQASTHTTAAGGSLREEIMQIERWSSQTNQSRTGSDVISQIRGETERLAQPQASQLNRLLNESELLLRMGHVQDAKLLLLNGLQQLQQVLQQQLNQVNSFGQQDAYTNQQLLARLNIESKQLLMTEITPRLEQLATSFRQAQRETIQLLEVAARQSQAAATQHNQGLLQAIDKLNNQLLKPELLKVTDMKMP